MEWRGWLQTVLNGLIAAGIGYGQAWSQGAEMKACVGAGIITGGAVLAGLFQSRPSINK
jgi:hypothetical protein